MEKKKATKKTDKLLTREEANDQRKARSPDFPGLDSIGDGGVVRGFINAVEAAFAELHQGSATLDEEEGDDSKPIDYARFSEWAQTVEDRFEFMGIQKRATNMVDEPLPGPSGAASVHAAGLRLWTKSVWARFAALGQVISD